MHVNAFYSSIPIPIRIEDLMIKIFILVALTFALIAVADRAPEKIADQDPLS